MAHLKVYDLTCKIIQNEIFEKPGNVHYCTKDHGLFFSSKAPGWSFQQRIHGGVLPPPHCPDKSGPAGSPTDTLKTAPFHQSLQKVHRLSIKGEALHNHRNRKGGFMERDFYILFRGTLPSKWSDCKGNCLSASARVLPLQLSETLQGRKICMSAN